VKALTIWQPWASLIMALAKPWEFREWNYMEKPWYRGLKGQRIVIHAGMRKVRQNELAELIYSLEPDPTTETSLIAEKALPLLHRWHQSPALLPLGAGLGTAILGEPKLPPDIFGRAVVTDSDRGEAWNWAWPLSDIRSFEPIVPCPGAQGFWDWPFVVAA
jgi:hypothetical protein